VSDPREGVRPSSCPSCNAVLDAATAADGSALRPTAGDASICLCCETFLFFTDGGALRLATDEEERELMKDDRVLAAIRAMSAAPFRSRRALTGQPEDG